MAGGLIQIASYGIHDIFLIGNPQITFFKTVYKRHSNFSMEYIQEALDGVQNFGGSLTCNLTKAGDLLHKLYVQIEIPQVLINKATFGYPDPNNSTAYAIFSNNYNIIINFLNLVNYNIIQPLYKLLKLTNINYTDINNKYLVLYNSMSYSNQINKLDSNAQNQPVSITFFNNLVLPLFNPTSANYNISTSTYINTSNSSFIPFNVSTIIKNYLDFSIFYNTLIVKTTQNIGTVLLNLLNNYVSQITLIKTQLQTILSYYKNITTIQNRTNMNFAWVNFLGHQILNRVEIQIGNKIIDFTDSVRMNIHYQLTNRIMHDITYQTLVGNVSSLTTYDSNIKPSYTLYVPLDFWFSKYSGLSLPLIYLRYHDVNINIKLNDLVNCCYYEQLGGTLPIEEIISLTSVKLIANYIYLDSDERKKFSQATHEYLIDQNQIVEYNNIISSSINVELPFFNPIKQLFWIIRDQNNISRLNYFDYSSNYYTDIYNILKAEDNMISTYGALLVKIQTVDINIANYIKVGDTITIGNSIYYNGTYKVINVLNEFIYIKYNFFMKENYQYNYNTTINSLNNTTTYTKSNTYTGNSQAFIKKITNGSPIKTNSLKLDGIERFYRLDNTYINFVQPYQNNSRSPDYGINTYSFCLNPEDHQPSGFCNFNRIDLKTLTLALDPNYVLQKTLNLTIYGYGYNVLRFEHGKAGIVLNI
jgi:hypothetical protein